MTQRLPAKTLSRRFPRILLGTLLTLAIVPSAVAQEKSTEKSTVPGAPRLLPEQVYAYIRLDNADDLREGLSESSTGKMLSDPKMEPLVTDVYSTMRDLFAQISDEVGVSLDELLSIPSGQVSAAWVAGRIPDPDDNAADRNNDDEDDESDAAIQRRLRQKRRDQNAFAGVFIVDAGDNVDKLRTIIERLEKQVIENDNYIRRPVKKYGVEVVRWLPPRTGRPEVEFFEREGTIVFGIGHRAAQDVLDRWEGKSEEPTLADSANFSSVMARCVGAESTRPQLTFYIDPYHIAERIVKRSGSFTVGMMWPMVESLGLERLRGIGASSFRGGEVFEDISHMHILIDPPRDGLFGVLRPETGESQPPKWVPSDVTTYSSLHWDIPQTYKNVGGILDTFQGEDSLKRFIEDPAEKAVKLDIQKELVENVTGRFVRATWMEPPTRVNSQVGAQAIEIKDVTKAKATLAKLRDRFPNVMTAETVGGTVTYFFRQGNRRNVPAEGPFRRPEPCMMFLGKWLIQTDSRKMIERIIRAHSGVSGGLVDHPDYDLISSELGGKLDGEKPFFVNYTRGADFLRLVYNLAAGEDAKQFIRRAAENDENAGRIADVLQRNDFPAFEEFEKYFAPSGVFAYDAPDGIHFGSFTLRADED